MIGWFSFFSGLLGGGIISLIVLGNKMLKWKGTYNEKKKISQLVETSKDIIYCYQVKPEKKFQYLSPSIKTILGTNPMQEAYSNPNWLFDIIHPDDYNLLQNKINGKMDYSKPIIQRWKNSKGKYIWLEENATPIHENGEFIGVQGIVRNIDEKVKLQHELEYQIAHDPLTKIYNRAYFQKQMKKYNEQKNVPVAILLCDLDGLKYMNDHFGHEQGDSFIIASTKLLNYYSTSEIIVARIGGDEFSIIMVNATKESAQKLYSDLHKDIEQYNENNVSVKISMSIGLSFAENSYGQMEHLLGLADQHMYKNKKQKKRKRLLVEC